MATDAEGRSVVDRRVVAGVYPDKADAHSDADDDSSSLMDEGCESESSCTSQSWDSDPPISSHQQSAALLQEQLDALQQVHLEMRAHFSAIAADQQVLMAELDATRHLWALTLRDNQLLNAKLRELQAQATLRRVRDLRASGMTGPTSGLPRSELASQLQALQEQHSVASGLQ